jgi:hypothetical protein
MAIAVAGVETVAVVRVGTSAEKTGNSLEVKSLQVKPGGFLLLAISMPLSPAITQRKQRWVNFLDISHPSRYVFLIRYAPESGTRPWPNPELKKSRIDWIWRNYEFHYRRMDWLDDDTIPYLDLYTGTEIFAEAFGCKIHRPADNMPFALSFINSPQEAGRLRTPSLDAPSLALAFEMADELRRRAGPEALVRLVDIQSPMDITALIWEKQSFYTALLESPEAVLELVDKVRALLISFLDEWFRRYGSEFIAHYPDYYLPQGISLSEDEIGAVNPGMFCKFFLPQLVELSKRYGGLGIHSCANSRHQWEHFQKIPHLKLLNLNQPEPVLREAYTYFTDFVPQWHYGWEPGSNPAEWMVQLPRKAHVVIDVSADTKEQALVLADQLRQLHFTAIISL